MDVSTGKKRPWTFMTWVLILSGSFHGLSFTPVYGFRF